MALGNYYFVLAGTGDGQYLTPVKGARDFAETGTSVLRVALSASVGITHMINSGPDGCEDIEYGVLSVRSSAGGPVLRSYGDWLLAERVPFDGR
ncbi:hypothetical protein AB1046_18000 [Promicromonospora sp. Populi]|uniref:hypothetical protein n=1 Tax=Promicromonospora sp. Populi TaxID=3239420 RepID=UPI0034E1ADAD